MKSWVVSSPEAMARLGAAIAGAIDGRDAVIGFSGALGTGKTTLIRGLLRNLEVTGRVRSPTYALIEVYALDHRHAYHLDLYRLVAPVELEFLGVRDLDAPGNLVLIEWPERGGHHLPPLDLRFELSLSGAGRRVRARAGSPLGQRILDGMPGVAGSE